MYERFFHLAAKPFDLLPNPDFLFLSKSHKRALSYLDYGIRERAGFILLTGEVGSGKTTLIRNLIRKHVDNVILSKIFNTRVDPEQLISMINEDFGLASKDRDKVTLLRELNDFLIEQFIKGNKPTLIVDEAQNLTSEVLEDIRMLSNLETDSAKLLQIILVGQPELRQTLAAPSMVQLRQRISINCHLNPLTRDEVEQYILHRLEKAGDRDAIDFTCDAYNLIFSYSRGIPRLINIICDFLLLSAFAEGTKKIDGEMVQDIIGDLDFDHHFWNEAGEAATTPPSPIPQATPAIPATAMPPSEAAGIVSLIKEIGRKIETMSRDAEAKNHELFQEITKKVESVEESLKVYKESTITMMEELRQEVYATGGNGGNDESSAEVEPKAARAGLIRRIFGA